MDFISQLAIITGLFSLTFMLNLPFGHLRNKARKFSFRWFLYIHMPIPIIIFARVSSQLDSRFIPIFVFAAVTGQMVGGKMEF